MIDLVFSPPRFYPRKSPAFLPTRDGKQMTEQEIRSYIWQQFGGNVEVLFENITSMQDTCDVYILIQMSPIRVDYESVER